MEAQIPSSEAKKNTEDGIEFNNSQPNSNIDLKNFSKRYAPELRDEMAHKLKTLRQKSREEAVTQNTEIKRKQGKISEALLLNEKQAHEIQQMIEEAEQTIQAEKSSFFGRIRDLVKTRNLEEELGLTKLKKDQEDNTRERERQEALLAEFMNLSLSNDTLQEARAELGGFYSEMSEVKSKFESEEETRSVENISKENKVLFVHMIGNNGYGARNSRVSFRDGLDLITAVNPTLSTSTIREGDMRVFGANTHNFNAGIIIGKGRLLTTAGMLTPDGFFSRRLNRSNGINFESDISETLPKAINKDDRNYHNGGSEYNELSVENVEPKAILVEYRGQIELPMISTDENGEENNFVVKSYEEVIDRSKETGTPIIVQKDGKLYRDCLSSLSYAFFSSDDGINIIKKIVSKEEALQLDQSQVMVSLNYDFTNEISIDEINGLPTPSVSDSEKINKIHSLIENGKIVKPESKEAKQLLDIYISLGGKENEITSTLP